MNDRVAAGWKEIAEMLSRSIATVKRLYYKCGLPVKHEGRSPTLTWSDYLRWRDSQAK